MAQGTLTTFEEFRKNIGDGSHNLSSDTFKIMLIDNTTVPTAADVTPDSADYTEVSGGTSYVAGGATLTTTYTEVGGVATFKHTGGTITWAKDAAGPTNIYYAIIYNATHTGTNDAIAFIDLTADGGVTPISLQSSTINIDLGGGTGNIFTLS